MTGVAVYHEMGPDETFETTAEILWQLVRRAVLDYPLRFITLYLDVTGHRNSAGGYDHDAFEINRFVIKMLMPYLREAHVPLIGGPLRNSDMRTDMPEKLQIRKAPQHRRVAANDDA